MYMYVPYEIRWPESKEIDFGQFCEKLVFDLFGDRGNHFLRLGEPVLRVIGSGKNPSISQAPVKPILSNSSSHVA